MRMIMSFLLCMLSFNMTAQDVSREDAIQMALTEYVVPQNLTYSLTAYIGKEPLQTGDILGDFISDTQIEIQSPSWFVWINDNADAHFEHTTRYLLIDVASAKSQVHYFEWWPEVNGETVFFTEDQMNDLNLIIYSDLHSSESKN